MSGLIKIKQIQNNNLIEPNDCKKRGGGIESRSEKKIQKNQYIYI
jgi:hypothetical protein